MIGLIGSVMFARAGIGLEKRAETQSSPSTDLGTLVKAFFPLWGTVFVLVVTRVPFLGIKALLTAETPAFSVPLGTLGNFSISAVLVAKLTQIFGTSSAGLFSTLYIPAFIPFFLVSALSLILFKVSGKACGQVWRETSHRMVRPILALLGALVMVKLMTVGGDQVMVIVIGQYFADLFGRSWQFFASYLGAIGAFFAGSNTVSNLMFAGIQKTIAESLGLDPTLILAMQSVGGAMGNMVCINNIVAVCSLLGILNQEGVIIKRTVVPMIVYGLIAGAVGFLLSA